MLPDTPVTATRHRSWADGWVVARCTSCGRRDHWPQPEVGCPCGMLLRIPVRPEAGTPDTGDTTTTTDGTERGLPTDADALGGDQLGAGLFTEGRPAAEGNAGGDRDGDGDAGSVGPQPGGPTAGTFGAVRPEGPPAGPGPAHIPLPRTATRPRPAFRPVAIRKAEDAVTAAGAYLTWLGFRGIGPPHQELASDIALRADGLVAQVDVSSRPTPLRDVECLWLHALSASAHSACFSLAGYTDDAAARAEQLGVALFALDLSGAPQPANGAADEMYSTGA
ncbi:hypothetical protein [uncultured Streptomyces sp.]|uniref:hypothetical protein n=1 Tax=uncultured Streptomyces sp. TaxID=174707 RepID=UPI002616AD59|nr:hypothetical protein [uncultured Streptomyces sp.]